jgi:hypothetical protein
MYLFRIESVSLLEGKTKDFFQDFHRGSRTKIQGFFTVCGDHLLSLENDLF